MIAAAAMIVRLANPRTGIVIPLKRHQPVLPHRARIAMTGTTDRPVATHPTEAATATSLRRHDRVPLDPNAATATATATIGLLAVTVMIAPLIVTKLLARRDHQGIALAVPSRTAPVRPAVADQTMPQTVIAIAMKRLAPSPPLWKHPLGSRPSRC